MNLILAVVAVVYGVLILALPFFLIGAFRRLREIESGLRHLRRTQEQLAGRLEELKASVDYPSALARGAGAVAGEAGEEMVVAKPFAGAPKAPPTTADSSVPATGDIQPAEEPPPRPGAEPPELELKIPRAAEPSLRETIKSWLLGGNLVARIGVLILFFGVAFSLKYAAERGWLPIELRLMATAVGGMALLGLGWRLLVTHRPYALVLQGGGMGIIYLTLFAAADLYELVPAGAGLVLMVVLVALSSALAVLQDARSLAALAAIGGFLAPVLISRGGSHVALFTYYAALDAGILGIAWFRAWRELNLLGFVFTFVIGSAWGYRFYQPEYFATTQPFLILFFIFYVAVPVLFALRQPLQLKGYVDGSLVFGVPLVAFALQSLLVRDFEYGLAISALCAGLFYAALATALWRRYAKSLRLLTEAFVALAVVFGTVAIPLAVHGRWTGAAWALEGAALVWVGVHQRRRLARVFGLLVQLGAGTAFWISVPLPASDVPVLNSLYLGALMVSLAGLVSAYWLYRHRPNLHANEREVATIALAWGLLWWFGAGGNEIWGHVGSPDRQAAALVFVAASAAVLTILRRRLHWAQLAYPPLVLLPAMVVSAAVLFADGGALSNPLARWGLAAWFPAFAIQYWLMRRLEGQWPDNVRSYSHLFTFWSAVFLLSWETAWFVAKLMPSAPTWRYVAWALVPTAVIGVLPRMARRLVWPLQRLKTLYLGYALALPVGLLALWSLFWSFQPGDPRPLPYVVVLNPLELTQCLVLIALFWWSARHWLEVPEKLRWYGWSALAFVTLNGIIARATHFWGGIPFDFHSLWGSPRLQAAVSITWTAAALLIMVSATRLRERAAWLAGSALLGAAVIKLFLVDLAGVGTVPRIVSFLVVGSLILLIGYLSPLPPKSTEQQPLYRHLGADTEDRQPET